MTTAAQALEALHSIFRDNEIPMSDYNGTLSDAVTNYIESTAAELEALRAATASVQADQRDENDRLRAELEALRKDAERYRWLRDLKCNSFTLGRDDDHACNYMSASEWIDNNPEWFRDDDPKEIERMRETNTIWCLQVYPNTPVGFNAWNASTLDATIDAALSAPQPKGVSE